MANSRCKEKRKTKMELTMKNQIKKIFTLAMLASLSAAPLHAMQKKGSPDISTQELKRLIAAKKQTINLHDADGLTPMLYAVQRNKYDWAQILIDTGADVNLPAQTTHVTPLHVAAFKGNLNMMKLLLDAGANVDAVDCKNSTPLHYAALEGKPEAAMLLLVEGVNCEIADGAGFTPLHIAAQKNNDQIVKLLIKYQANVHARTKAQNTPLMLTFDPYIAQLLIDAGSDLEASDVKGNSVLLRASFLGKEELTEFFIARGVNINIHGFCGKTPLHIMNPNIRTIF